MLINNANITGSLTVIGTTVLSGSLAVSTFSGSGVRYLVSDEAGNMTAQTASAAIKNNQVYTASAGQTTFTVTNGYTTGLADVFINGTKLLAGTEYTDTSGTNIVLATGSFANDIVEVVTYQPASGVTNNSLRQITYFTASAGQTVFSASYVPGLLDIFYNGSKLDNSEYTAANGTSITLATASLAGDKIEVDVYSYQVGSFSGVGGTGVANQIAYWNTTNSITGSNIYISGSNVGIGTSSPSTISTYTTLDIKGATGGGIKIGKISTASLNIQQDGVNAYLNNLANGNIFFYTNDTERMCITSTGNIGIGTSSPWGKFNVYAGSNLSFVVQDSGIADTIELTNYSSGGGIRGIQLNGSVVTFGTGTAGGGSTPERMRITSTGYVGINTNSPSSPLSVSGSGNLTSIIDISANTSSTVKTHLGQFSTNTYLTNNWYYNGTQNADSTSYGQTAIILDGTGFIEFATSSPGTSAPSTRLRIGSGGAITLNQSAYFICGTTGYRFNDSSDANNNVIMYNNGNMNIRGGLAIGNTADQAGVFYIASQVMSSNAGTHYLKWNSANGKVTYDSSTRLVKSDIIDSPYGLNEILQLKPRKYYRIDDEKNEIGFIADEVYEILPELVPMSQKSLFTKDENDTELIPSGVNYDKITAVLVKALQEANTKITALEEKLERNNIQ